MAEFFKVNFLLTQIGHWDYFETIIQRENALDAKSWMENFGMFLRMKKMKQRPHKMTQFDH